MGELVLAAKVTHVPTMLLSEQPGALKGSRKPAIEGHREIGRRARAAGADTVIVLDTHWLVNAAYHINSNKRFKGTYTSHEFPHFIQNLDYDYRGNPELGDLIAEKVPLYYQDPEAKLKVVSVAAWCTVHSLAASRQLGEAIREAIEASDSKVVLLASGSLSHKIWENELYEANNGTFTISSEFNRQMDLRVLDLWRQGEFATFVKMLPEYAEHCCGEGGMHDTAMLLGALGWDDYGEGVEIVTEYFPSSGTGQVIAAFPV